MLARPGGKSVESLAVATAAVEFLGLHLDQVPVLASLLDDPSCWIGSADLSGIAVIRVPSPSPKSLTLFLSRAQAGVRLPHHVHAGRERIRALVGGFREVAGRAVRAGETLVSDAGTTHTIDIDPDGDCICAVRMEFDEPHAVQASGIGVQMEPNRAG